MTARRVALLGAESTGKTTLAGELQVHLQAQGLRVAVVAEVLREWCQRAGRSPRPEEQLAIAQEQERRVDAAAAGADLVIADTTALMVAIYSAMLFEDGTLYRFALERQRGYHANLLTGLDLPWVPDGLQRDGPHVQGPIDALVREALQQAQVPYHVVYGHGPARLASALQALGSAGVIEPAQPPAAQAAAEWSWRCEKCSDPVCEHRLFRRLLPYVLRYRRAFSLGLLCVFATSAIQLLPIQEFQTRFSLGYNGTDYFSPEMDFAVDDADLRVNVDIAAASGDRSVDAKPAVPVGPIPEMAPVGPAAPPNCPSTCIFC